MGSYREYPAPLRRLVEREFVKIAPRYTDAAFVMTDLVTQLHREGLLAWTDAVITTARDRQGITVSAEEAAKRFAEEEARGSTPRCCA